MAPLNDLSGAFSAGTQAAAQASNAMNDYETRRQMRLAAIQKWAGLGDLAAGQPAMAQLMTQPNAQTNIQSSAVGVAPQATREWTQMEQAMPPAPPAVAPPQALPAGPPQASAMPMQQQAAMSAGIQQSVAQNPQMAPDPGLPELPMEQPPLPPQVDPNAVAAFRSELQKKYRDPRTMNLMYADMLQANFSAREARAVLGFGPISPELEQKLAQTFNGVAMPEYATGTETGDYKRNTELGAARMAYGNMGTAPNYEPQTTAPTDYANATDDYGDRGRDIYEKKQTADARADQHASDPRLARNVTLENKQRYLASLSVPMANKLVTPQAVEKLDTEVRAMEYVDSLRQAGIPQSQLMAYAEKELKDVDPTAYAHLLKSPGARRYFVPASNLTGPQTGGSASASVRTKGSSFNLDPNAMPANPYRDMGEPMGDDVGAPPPLVTPEDLRKQEKRLAPGVYAKILLARKANMSDEEILQAEDIQAAILAAKNGEPSPE
jgi:hypothetical protein